ncbi:aminotransferase-like domain-containing protein [Embleya sp. NPDC001921]
MEDFRRVADAVQADIEAGRLRPGDRLATQRQFARTHGIATSTAGRVYAELRRRGLILGEVGRGTFVRAAAERPLALSEPSNAPADLELSVPTVPEQFPLLAEGLARMQRPDVLRNALLPVGVSGTAEARAAAATTLACAGWAPDPADILFAGSGRQAIAATIAALVPPGGRLGVEELTYPVVRAIAARLGVVLVPLAMDSAGVRPAAVAAAHRAARLQAIYLQPTLHNPLSITMPAERRNELAALANRLRLPVIEDAVWSRFDDAALPPIALKAPEYAVVVDSLSKRVTPGLSIGMAVVPPRIAGAVRASLRTGAWTAQRYALEAATGWMSDGTLGSVLEAKRVDARVRQEAVRSELAGFRLRTAPGAYMCWWELPEPWRADTFVAAAARRGIAVTPGAAFAVPPATAHDAIRLGLASQTPDALSAALRALAALAGSIPEHEPVD